MFTGFLRSIAGLRCQYPLSGIFYGGSLWRKAKNKKVQFIVVREFSGDKTMWEAFEQVIERQTCEQFEKWLENHEIEQKAA